MPRRPRTAEDDAAFKGMGLAIAYLREQRGMECDDLAAKIEEAPEALEKIDPGLREGGQKARATVRRAPGSLRRGD